MMVCIIVFFCSREGTNPELSLEKLPAHFYVWLASTETRFLKGKYVWANWDVEELKARAEKIESSNLLTVGLRGVDM